MTASFSIHHKLDIDGSLKKEAMDFLMKLQQDPSSPSLHVEPIHGTADPRVRTGRVNLKYRAVMFELRDANQHHFVIVDILMHDEAIARAKKVSLKVNPVNGITELIELTTPDVDTTASVDESRAKADQAAREAFAQVDAEISEQTQSRPSPGQALTAAGIDHDTLVSDLGISTAVAEAVFRVETEDELDGALEGHPVWEGDAVLGLVAGLSIEEVKDSLGLMHTSEAEEDTQLIEGIKSPAAQLEFAYLEDATDDELRNVLETGDFNKWRIFIHPEQRDIVERNFSGAGRVFGGAGTGKTVVTVHRAHRLATETVPAPRVLLTTYTRGLADSLKDHMSTLDPVYPVATNPGNPGIHITGIDALVSAVLSHASPEEIRTATRDVLGLEASSVRPFPQYGESRAWLEAIDLSESDLPPALANETFLAQEYETVVIAGGITTEKDYLRVPRPGRGTALNRGQRKAVWSLLSTFITASARDGLLTWPALAAVAARVLLHRSDTNSSYLFDHVLVDEAQDFHAGHWLFLRACVTPGKNDIFISEDAHQRIYGQHYVLSRFGIVTRGRASRRLRLNYRTTRENLGYALQVLDGTWIDADGNEDSITGYRSARSGPAPRLIQFDTEAAELEGVAALITRWLDDDPSAHIGVLARTNPLVNRATSALTELGIHAVKTSHASTDNSKVQIMTMHGAKGMEFTHVVLIGVDDGLMPQPYTLKGLGEAEVSDAIQRERSLLYVAASRARDQLVITTHGEPSKLLVRR